MEARISVGSRSIRLACVHLFPPVGKHRKSDGFLDTMKKNAALRREQAEYLVRRYATEKGPLLVVGDMNEGRRVH